jgi:hypothetical protein
VREVRASRNRRTYSAMAALLLAAGAFALSAPIHASQSGVLPPQGCTCHSADPNTEVEISVTGFPSIYTPGEQYPLTIIGEGPVVGAGGGLSMDVTKGTLASSDPAVSAGASHATHNAGTKRSWTVTWTAPAEDSGNVRLTVYVQLTNGDGSDGPEDQWNVLQLTAMERAPEPPKPSTLTLSYAGPGQTGAAGENFTVQASLVNATGAPIPNASIEFQAKLTWGFLPLGTSSTDANGTATVNWSVPAPGGFLVTGTYGGSSKNLSSNATTLVTVTDPHDYWSDLYGGQETGLTTFLDPVRIPLGLLVGGVWATFFYATFLVLRVRKAGPKQDDGVRDLLKLLFSRSEGGGSAKK